MSRVTLALSAAALVAAIVPATAADMYGRNAPAASYGGGYSEGSSSPAAQWQGGYVGAQVGYGWGRRDVTGGQGGIYGGANAAIGSNIVVGAEADLSLSGQERYSVSGGSLLKQSSSWNGSIRGRAGVAFDKIMPYATAGIALADDTVKGFGANDTTTKVGYVAGMGVEGRVTDKVSLKGELVHYGFGGTNHVNGAVTTNNNVSATVLRTGAAYKF